MFFCSFVVSIKYIKKIQIYKSLENFNRMHETPKLLCENSAKSFWGGTVHKSEPLPFYIPFLTDKVPLPDTSDGK